MRKNSRTQIRIPLPKNPFCAPGPFQLPLKRETCQQIYAAALRKWAQGDRIDGGPIGFSQADLRQQIHWYGSDTCLLHPADITRIFQGVTLAVYQAIEELYCSRLERSVQTVRQILHAQARQQGIAPITDEAIWAICLYLEKRRQEQVAVTTRHDAGVWWLGTIAQVSLSCPAESSHGEHPSFLALGVIDLTQSRVLAIQGGMPHEREQLGAQALYEAIIAARVPDVRGTGGLIWHLPSKILVEEKSLPTWQAWSGAVRLPLKTGAPTPFVEELRSLWVQVFRSRTLPPDRWTTVFESALNATYGTSPLRTRESSERTFNHLRGYMADPALLFPALRLLLPQKAAVITPQGEIVSLGLHYTDELLTLWPATPVIIRASIQTEATIWVYLDREILCQARARELASVDGSYRSHQWRR